MPYDCTSDTFRQASNGNTPGWISYWYLPHLTHVQVLLSIFIFQKTHVPGRNCVRQPDPINGDSWKLNVDGNGSQLLQQSAVPTALSVIHANKYGFEVQPARSHRQKQFSQFLCPLESFTFALDLEQPQRAPLTCYWEYHSLTDSSNGSSCRNRISSITIHSHVQFQSHRQEVAHYLRAKHSCRHRRTFTLHHKDFSRKIVLSICRKSGD